MKTSRREWFAGVVLLCAMLVAQAQEVPEEARKHNVRGATALQMAKSQDELSFAIKEFQQAVRIAPDWPVAWFNLGTVQEKADDIAGAIVSFKRYVELVPDAPDTAQVRDRLIALEYMQERLQQAAGLSGTWGAHQVTVEGTKFTAVGKTEHYNFIDVFFSGDVQQGARYPALDDRFEGTIQGNTIKGTVTRAAFVEQKSECLIPEERAEFTGKINEDGTKITLEYERGHYRADWNGIFWGLEECTGVTRNGSTPITQVFARVKPEQTRAPEPGLPVTPNTGLVGIQVAEMADGGFSVAAVMPGRSAERAGIQAGDVIVAVDDVDMTKASKTALLSRMRGEPGTTVSVKVLRGNQAFQYWLKREAAGMKQE